MTELEKILDEIGTKIVRNMGRKREGLLEAESIIRKYLTEKDTDIENGEGVGMWDKILEEIEIKKEKCLDVVKVEIDPMEIAIHREQYKGLRMAEDIIKKHMNDGWISVEERLPEDDIDVLITYADMEDEKETDIAITTYGYATLGGRKLCFKEWRSPFLYFKGNYKVIAWQPLPEPYRTEKEV